MENVHYIVDGYKAHMGNILAQSEPSSGFGMEQTYSLLFKLHKLNQRTNVLVIWVCMMIVFKCNVQNIFVICLWRIQYTLANF